MIRNPVMFVVEAGSALTTLLWLQALFGKGEAPAGFIGAISAWLWFTVLLLTLLRHLRKDGAKHRLNPAEDAAGHECKKALPGYEVVKGREPVPSDYLIVSSSTLHRSDLFYVKAGDTIPVDGDVIQGIASVNESAITGESAPVIRESGRRPERCDRRNGRAFGLAHYPGKCECR